MSANMDAFNYLPEDVQIPRLYETEGQLDDAVALVKLFTPDSSWTWYIIEYNPEEDTAYGLVDGHERELGYFTVQELRELRGPMGLPVERDLYFEPTKLKELWNR